MQRSDNAGPSALTAALPGLAGVEGTALGIPAAMPEAMPDFGAVFGADSFVFFPTGTAREPGSAPTPDSGASTVSGPVPQDGPRIGDDGTPLALVVTASAAVTDPGAGITPWGVSAAWSGPAASTALLDRYVSGLGGLGVESGFNIEIVFEGSWTVALQDAFILAAEYLSSLIPGDVRGGSALGVDDIRITASLVDIDGPGGVLGQAGPTGARFFSKLPTTGIMEFDIADAEDYDAEGLFADIVLHEMIHCLGFGTIWDLLGLTEGTVRGGDIVFTGEWAILAYNTVFSDIAAGDPGSLDGVPVETRGGSGTAGSHWDDALFTTELMTGFIDDVNVVSAMTLASLEDLGYDTIWSPDDPGAALPQPDDLLA